MARKNNENKSKATNSSKPVSTPAKPASKAKDAYSRVIETAMEKGYSKDVITKTLSKLWDNGVDIDNYNVCLKALLAALPKPKTEKPVDAEPEKKKKTKSAASKVEAAPKVEDFEAVNKKLIEKLNTVASYSNINQVLIGFNQWYDVANEVEKNVFYKSDILNVILLNFFSSQQDSQTEKLFSQFFMNFYQFNDQASSQIVQGLFAIKESKETYKCSIPDLCNEISKLFDDCHLQYSSKLNIEKNLNEMISFVEENSKNLSSPASKDVSTQFKYRDQCSKVVKNMMSIINITKPASSTALSLNKELLCPVPEGSAEIIDKVPELKEQFSSIQTEYDTKLSQLKEKETITKTELNLYKDQEQSLLEQLEAVRQKIKSKETEMKTIESNRQSAIDSYKNQIQKLNHGNDDLRTLIQQIEARSHLLEGLETLISQSNDLLQSIQEQTIDNKESLATAYQSHLLTDFDSYYKQEYCCYHFLEQHITKLEAEVQSKTFEENKLRSLGITLSSDAIHKQVEALTQKVENNKKTMNFLKNTAMENEQLLSTYLNQHLDYAKEHLTLLSSIYSSIHCLSIASHLVDELTALIKIEAYEPEAMKEVASTSTPQPKQKIVKPVAAPAPAPAVKLTWATKKVSSDFKSLSDIQQEEKNNH